MCMFKAPKIPKTPPAAERQAMQAPRDTVDPRTGMAIRKRRGMWASLFTSPQGITSAPIVTGMASGVTGG